MTRVVALALLVFHLAGAPFAQGPLSADKGVRVPVDRTTCSLCSLRRYKKNDLIAYRHEELPRHGWNHRIEYQRAMFWGRGILYNFNAKGIAGFYEDLGLPVWHDLYLSSVPLDNAYATRLQEPPPPDFLGRKRRDIIVVDPLFLWRTQVGVIELLEKSDSNWAAWLKPEESSKPRWPGNMADASIGRVLTHQVFSTVLYHEYGHLVLGHVSSRRSARSSVELELEADGFAGFLMGYGLGSRRFSPQLLSDKEYTRSIQQIGSLATESRYKEQLRAHQVLRKDPMRYSVEVWQRLYYTKEDSRTHPSSSKRLKAMREGFDFGYRLGSGVKANSEQAIARLKKWKSIWKKIAEGGYKPESVRFEW